MLTARESSNNVLTVEFTSRRMVVSRLMFVGTLVQSRTRVNSVQNILERIHYSRHICWSHTMKVLGWRVTFARRSSATKVTLRCIYVDIKVWSRMLAMIVQSVSVQQWKCDFITWCTPMLNTFAVVFVVKILKVNKTLEFTLGDVLEGWTWIDF